MSFNRKKGAIEGKDTYSSNFFADLRITPLFDLYTRANIELQEIKTLAAEERDVDNSFANNDMDVVVKQFTLRKQQLESVIDAHLNELLKATK